MSQMKPIQQRDIIRCVRDKWLQQHKNYSDDQKVGWADGKTPGSIRKVLADLDLETCSAADVDAAIGITGWAKNRCDECDGDFAVVLQLGQEPDHEARWWNLCGNCLVKARDLLASSTEAVTQTGRQETIRDLHLTRLIMRACFGQPVVMPQTKE